MGFERVKLGRTGLSVCPIGIASSYGTNEAMVEEAVDRGVNYLYWGALRTKKMGRGIRSVARRRRDDLVIVAHTTTRSPSTLSKVVQKALRQLGVDCLDVLLLGWHNKRPDPRLIEHASKLKNEGLVRFSACSRSSKRTDRSTSSTSDTMPPTEERNERFSITSPYRTAPAWSHLRTPAGDP
jgi:aryl-alcohol dehydrogenase-like predicted oxidoreductase